MIDPLQFPSHNHENQPQETGREQVPGESTMWFNRYRLYRDMGFKRSLRGAVALERERLHTVKVETATTSHDALSAAQGTRREQALQSVASVKQVPGSWKDASVRFHWQERVHAYEAWLLTAISRDMLGKMARSYANKFERILTLQEMVKTTKESARRATMIFPIEEIEKSHKLAIAYTKQIQSLLADLRAETKDISDETLLHWIELFNHAHPDRWSDKKPTDQ